uniref:Uncharacterized protein n=1 Tax=Salmonella sp. TaxID=599 RepID=A0A482ETT1_SALSP|nr:hypothetical protein NNIBIDOC_00205 [Salmonella sp.]
MSQPCQRYRIPPIHMSFNPEGYVASFHRGLISFMNAFNRMSEAEHRKRWYHPKMGQFRVIGWGGMMTSWWR